MAEKIDLMRENKSDYAAKPTPEVKDIAPGSYLTLTGQGAPDGESFDAGLQALYPVAYGIKMSLRRDGKDFKVNPLDGLWWITSDKPYLEVPRDEWQWKLLIHVPDFVGVDDLERTKQAVLQRKGLIHAEGVALERIDEGLCVQVLHVGPYTTDTTESETLAKMKLLIDSEGYEPHGYHHEIYLSDPRRAAPERMKTILRQPVRQAPNRT